MALHLIDYREKQYWLEPQKQMQRSQIIPGTIWKNFSHLSS